MLLPVSQFPDLATPVVWLGRFWLQNIDFLQVNKDEALQRTISRMGTI